MLWCVGSFAEKDDVEWGENDGYLKLQKDMSGSRGGTQC